MKTLDAAKLARRLHYDSCSTPTQATDGLVATGLAPTRPGFLPKFEIYARLPSSGIRLRVVQARHAVGLIFGDQRVDHFADPAAFQYLW